MRKASGPHVLFALKCVQAFVRLDVFAFGWHAAKQAAKDNEPPVGFEPTTSRLLSGCSAS